MSCSDWDTRLILFNGSNHDINYYFELMNVYDFKPNQNNCDKTILPILRPSKTVYLRTQNKWELYLKDNPNKVLRVFIINSDTLTKYGVCNVFKEKKFIKTMNFSYNDLDKLKWKITFR